MKGFKGNYGQSFSLSERKNDQILLVYALLDPPPPVLGNIEPNRNRKNYLAGDCCDYAWHGRGKQGRLKATPLALTLALVLCTSLVFCGDHNSTPYLQPNPRPNPNPNPGPNPNSNSTPYLKPNPRPTRRHVREPVAREEASVRRFGLGLGLLDRDVVRRIWLEPIGELTVGLRDHSR